MNLAEIDLQILHVIELEPTISVQKIAEEVEKSWITVNRHIAKLQESGVISNPIAVFNPRNLGLERHIILFQVKNEKQLQILEAACDIHPYTHYRTRVYGSYTGLFTQFDIPPEGLSNLRKFIGSLKEQGLSSQVLQVASTGHRFSTHTNLELFDAKTMRWNFDWNKWSKTIEQSSSDISDVSCTLETPALSDVDLQILRDLTANAKILQGELQEKYGISQSTVSRKMINIHKQYIESIRAQIDRSRFDVTSTKLFYCEKSTPENRSMILNAFQNEKAPPFPMSIDLLEKGGVLIWGRMPPSHEHKLYYALWKFLPELQVFTMDTIGDHSRLYWFYPENYDSMKHKWKIDYGWMVDDPLSTLQEKIT